MRATSEPPPDLSNIGLPTPPSSVSPARRSFTPQHSPSFESPSSSGNFLKLDLPLETEEEYSWEWGSFPQKTPVRATFGKYDTLAGSSKGKARMEDDVEDISSDYFVTSSRAGEKPRLRSKLSQTIFEGISTDDENVFGSGGLLTVDRRDPTRFRVFIEGKTAEFELSLIPRREFEDRDARSDSCGFLDREDEVEDARIFEEGKVDFQRFLDDGNILNDQSLVLRWAGVQYALHFPSPPHQFTHGG